MFYIGRCAKAINLPRMYAVHTTVLIFYFYFIFVWPNICIFTVYSGKGQPLSYIGRKTVVKRN